MKVSDIYKHKCDGKMFAIVEIEYDSHHQKISLVEVSPSNTNEHLKPDEDPIVINIEYFNFYYQKTD